MSGSILVVDDGTEFCRGLAAKLAGKGYRADYTFDVASAADKLSAKELDLVVVSCAGEKPCCKLVEQIRNISPDIPIVTFEVPDSRPACEIAEDYNVRMVTLQSWDVSEAAAQVSEYLESVIKNTQESTGSGQLLFAQGKQVDIQILGAHKTGMLTSSIVRRDDRYLYLGKIKDITGRAYSIPVRSSLKVGVAGRDAHYNFTTQVLDIVEDPQSLIKLSKPVVIYRTQRRKHPRFPMKLPIKISAYYDDSETQTVSTEGTTVDISRSGVRISVPEYIEPGEVITVDIPAGEKNQQISGLAYVLRANTDPEKTGYVIACHFSRIDNEIESLLESE